MTCIVGIEYHGKVALGGDIQGTGWNNKVVHTQPKVFNKNGVLFGYTTSYRFGQIIEHLLQDPVVPDRDDEVYRWLISTLIPGMDTILDKNGWEKGGCALIGVRGQLWQLQEDFSVLRSVKGYASVGSGNEYATASVATQMAYGRHETEDDYLTIIKRAIEVAGTFCPSVGTESTIISARR